MGSSESEGCASKLGAGGEGVLSVWVMVRYGGGELEGFEGVMGTRAGALP